MGPCELLETMMNALQRAGKLYGDIQIPLRDLLMVEVAEAIQCAINDGQRYQLAICARWLRKRPGTAEQMEWAEVAAQEMEAMTPAEQGE